MMREWLRRVFRPRTFDVSNDVTVAICWSRWLVGVEFGRRMLQVYVGPVWLWVTRPGYDGSDF